MILSPPLLRTFLFCITYPHPVKTLPSTPTKIGPISVKTQEDISQQIFTISK